jgi:hypothetical protein
MSTRTFWESQFPVLSEKTTDNLHTGAVGGPVIFEETNPMKLKKKMTGTGEGWPECSSCP